MDSSVCLKALCQSSQPGSDHPNTNIGNLPLLLDSSHKMLNLMIIIAENILETWNGSSRNTKQMQSSDIYKAEMKTDNCGVKARKKVTVQCQKHPGKRQLASNTHHFQMRESKHSPGRCGALPSPFIFPLLCVQRLLVGTIFHLSENQQPGACRAVKPPTRHVHTETSLMVPVVQRRHLALLNFLMWWSHNLQGRMLLSIWDAACVPVMKTVKWQETKQETAGPACTSFSSRLNFIIKRH